MKISTLCLLATLTFCLPANMSAKKALRKKQADNQHHKSGIKKANTEEILNKIYTGTKGKISSEETLKMRRDGAAPQYGEILYDSAEKLFSYLNLGPDDVFYDLGSGLGKMSMQTYLNTPVKKVVGIELSETRLNKAQEAMKKLKSGGYIKKNRSIEFIHGDITKTQCKDATVIYMCSTCYSRDLLKKISDNLASHKGKLKVITL